MKITVLVISMVICSSLCSIVDIEATTQTQNPYSQYQSTYQTDGPPIPDFIKNQIASGQINLNQQIPQYPEWPLPPPTTAHCVDTAQYIGLWYQQGWIPAIFQVGCSDVTAEYQLNEDGSIKVNNTCIRNGAQYSDIGIAVIDQSVEPQTNSKLLVSFPAFPGGQGEYWIVRLGQKYEYAVVSDSKYRFLWILSREPVMPENRYKQIVCDLALDGFPVYRIQRTIYTGKPR